MSGKHAVVLLVTALTVAVTLVAPAASAPARRTIRVEQVGVAFDIPLGVSAVQQDVTEGGWASIVTFARQIRPGHLSVIPVRLVFWPTGYAYGSPVPEHTPSQYVDAEFRHVKESVKQSRGGYTSGPDLISLFGNRAIRYSFTGLDEYVVVIGYLRAGQLPAGVRGGGGEILVRIDTELDGSAAEVFHAIVGSIRTYRTSELRTASH